MLSISRFACCVPRPLRRLYDDRRGVSAIEFGMVAPLMVALYFGAIELSQGIAIDRKVTLAARTVTDLVSQATTLNGTEMTNLLDAGTAVVAPYRKETANKTLLKVTVSQIKIDADRNPTIEWSVATKDATPKTTAETLPDAFRTANSYLIWGVAEYEYTPGFTGHFIKTVTLKDQIYMRVRQQARVQYTP